MTVTEIVQILDAARRGGLYFSTKDNKLQIKLGKGMSADPGLLETIRLNKDVITDFLVNGQWQAIRVGTEGRVGIVAVEKSGNNIPLSYGQERMWVIDRMEGSVQYHMPVVLRFRGNLNKGALEWSIRQIIDRHEVLRTVIVELDGKPCQRVQEAERWVLVERDMRGVGAFGLRGHIEALIRRPFNLDRDYMIRLELLGVGEDECIVVMVLHHIASDAWSLPILVRELTELYDSYVEGRPSRLAKLSVQYADYAIWQREHFQGDSWDKKLVYWREQLLGVEELRLPTDHIRPDVPGIHGESVGTRLNKEMTDSLQILSQNQGVSLYMLLLTGFKILLHRYSGQDDICIGSSIAGRQHDEVSELIGFFANTLALRSQVKAEMRVRELLGQVKQTTLDGYEHQEVPFEKLVELSGVKRKAGTNPLFKVMFVMDNTPAVGRLGLGDTKWKQESGGELSARFDISLSLSQSAAGIEVLMTCRKDLYEQATIRRMLDHYEQILRGMLRDLEERIGSIPMVSMREREELFSDFGNGPKPDAGKEMTMVELFREQAGRTPDRIAVVYKGEEMCYRELEERSNQLGHYLRRKGVRVEMPVPICMERSVDAIVSIMGIWKAGGAYVPIDPEYPADRILYMLEDTGAKVVVSMSSCKGLVLKEGIEVVVIDEEWERICREVRSAPVVELKAGHLAYVIYTSGSTGCPKGVLIGQGSLVDYVNGLKERLGVGECRRYGLVSTLSADLGNTVIYSSMVNGGTLHILSTEAINDSRLMREYFREWEIDCLKITPSHWKALCEDGGLLVPKKLLIFGGESLGKDIVESLLSGGAACRIVNHYGPTETTIGKLLHVLNAEGEYVRGIPIGRPFSDSRVYILDKGLGVCPIGVAGELYIAGAGVARGYLNRPELTAERFVVNPFEEEGVRMYRTGDIGRWLADGNIEYLGRTDEQLKIRGYRVEPEEIERVLEGSGKVRQSVVVGRDDGTGSKRLVGYVVVDGVFDREGVMSYLMERLPEYMVPGIWEELQVLPLTPNGKVDKGKLPMPEMGGHRDKRRYSAPRTELERELAGIWEGLLDVKGVGINDNFFELGGHSLLAIRLVSAIRQTLQWEVSIGDIFDHPTIAMLGPALKKKISDVRPQLEAEPQRPYYQITPTLLYWVDKNIDKEYKENEKAHGNISLNFRVLGDFYPNSFSKAFSFIVRRHESLRATFHYVAGKYMMRVEAADPEKPEVEFLDARHFVSENKNIMEGFLTYDDRPFSLSEGPLLMSRVIGIGDKEHIVSLRLHHIISDAWSNHILVKEILIAYRDFCLGITPRLNDLKWQLRDFLNVDNRYRVDNYESHKAYWKKAWPRLPEDLHMPMARRHENKTLQDKIMNDCLFNIPEDLRSWALSLAGRFNTSLFVILQATFKSFIFFKTGRQDLLIGTMVSGRDHPEMLGQIGCYARTDLIRTSIDVKDSFFEVIEKVKFANEEMAVYTAYTLTDAVVDLLGPGESLSSFWKINIYFSDRSIFHAIADIGEIAKEIGIDIAEMRKVPVLLTAVDLTLEFLNGQNQLDLFLQYDKSSYDEKTVRALFSEYFDYMRNLSQ